MLHEYERVRQDVAKQLGEDVLFAWEVKHTLDDLGLYISSFTHGNAAKVHETK